MVFQPKSTTSKKAPIKKNTLMKQTKVIMKKEESETHSNSTITDFMLKKQIDESHYHSVPDKDRVMHPANQ